MIDVFSILNPQSTTKQVINFDGETSLRDVAQQLASAGYSFCVSIHGCCDAIVCSVDDANALDSLMLKNIAFFFRHGEKYLDMLVCPVVRDNQTIGVGWLVGTLHFLSKEEEEDSYFPNAKNYCYLGTKYLDMQVSHFLNGVVQSRTSAVVIVKFGDVELYVEVSKHSLVTAVPVSVLSKKVSKVLVHKDSFYSTHPMFVLIIE